MKPFEAKVFSSGISRLLSSKQHSDVAYSRLNQVDDSVEFSKVHFHKDRTSFCGRLCFGSLALMLLIATVGSVLFIMNMKQFTVEVQLKQGNVRVYRFNQQLTIVGNKITTRNVSIVASTHLINRTESDCWFGIVLILPDDKKKHLSSKDFAFLTRVTSAEIDDGALTRFKVYGNRKTSDELSFYVHNILRQLLPVIKVKLYEFVLSKVTSSSRRVVVEKQGFLPGRVHLKRTMITKDDAVTVMVKAGPDDFDNFSASKNKESQVASWKLSYDETSVVNKKTGMLKRSDMSMSGIVPLAEDFDPKRSGSHQQGLAVTFRSIVNLLDASQVTVKDWKTVVKEENDISHPLNFPSVEQSSLEYFAPPKRKLNHKPSNELLDLIRLSKDSTGKSTKLPKIINIVHHKIPKSDFVKSDLIDNDESDDYINDDETSDEGDNEDENDNDDDENDDVDIDNEPSWPMPNFAPFGLGYEVKRKRSLETKRTQGTNSIKTTGHPRLKKKPHELDILWDELLSSTPIPNHEVPRVIQTSVLGLDFQAEIDYQVHVNDDDDDDDGNDSDGRIDNDDYDDDIGWDVTTTFRVTLGQYRITPFRRVHTLRKIKGRLPPIGQRRSTHWVVNGGDFIMCVPLFYIHRLCAAASLSFDVTVTYSLPRVSLSYPTELTVHIGQTVTNNATISAHALTWLHESGFYTKGTVARGVLPVRLSFREDKTPEWCITGNVGQKMVRMSTVPLSSWNCFVDHHDPDKKCVGLPAASNRSLVAFDLHYSSAEGTMFDNWHYPVSCSRRWRFPSY